jgi:tetratricopeptide (TPR) repeat protein
MQRIAIIVVIAVTSFAVAQQQPTTPAGQSPSQSGSTAKGSTAQGATPAAPQQGKRPPQAKTQPEFDAYKAAMNDTDPAALEKATEDFAAKFPDSELRVLLYRATMHDYQNANNSDKMLDMAQKVLKIDPDDPEALVGASEVIAERTRDTDLDKDQRLSQALQYSQRALETIETDVAIPAGTPQDKIDTYKGFLRSTAYSILGTIYFNQEKYPDAESYFHKSIDAYPSQPDPVVVLRLALTLDKEGRYPDALTQANHAVELTQENTSAGTLARREKDRLAQLTGGSAPAPAAKTPAPTTPAPAPH